MGSREMSFDASNEVACHMMNEVSTISKRSDYDCIQTSRQRVYAPFDAKEMPHPPRGSEVYIGNLLYDMYEDELLPLFESVGPLYKFRLMLNLQYENRGYAFATYFREEDADSAVRRLHGLELRPGCRIKVLKSVDNRCLFVGNLPYHVTQREVMEILRRHLDGIINVKIQSDYKRPHLNMGYAFLEFAEHQLAMQAWRKFTPGYKSLVAWGQTLFLDWAAPIPEVDPRIMSKVSILYLKNLPIEYSSDELRAILSRIVGAQLIRKVHQIYNYAFVHFVNRPSAEFALGKLSDFKLTDLRGYQRSVQVEWARPRRFSKGFRTLPPTENLRVSLPSMKRKMVFQWLLGQPPQ